MAPRRAKASNEAQVPPVATDIAVNIYGHAIPIPNAESRVQYQVINAWQPSSKNVEAGQKFHKNLAVDRPNFDFTAREKSNDDEPSTTKFMVIGYGYPELQGRNRYLNNVVRKKAVGVQDNRGNEIDLPKDKSPWIIVSQIKGEEHAQGIDYHVLHFMESDLCHPMQVQKQWCFYLPEFRNHATTQDKRKEEWDAAVKMHAIRPALLAEPSQKQAAMKRAYDTTALALPRDISFANEMVCLTEGFKETEEMWFVRAMEKSIQEVEEDLQYAEKPDIRGLKAFVESEEDNPFTKELAEATLLELYGSDERGWLISADDMLRLKQAVNASGVEIEYHLLRGILSVVIRHMSKQPGVDDDDLVEMVKDVCEDARLMDPKTTGLVRITPDESRVAFQAIRTKLQEVVDRCDEYEQRMQRLAGDKGRQATIYETYFTYRDSIDTSASKQAFSEAFWFVIRQIREREKGVGEMVQDIIDILDKRMKF